MVWHPYYTFTNNAVAPPTINWQAGGAGYPVKRKRKDAKRLFDSIERTLRDTLNPPPVQAQITTKRAAVDLDAALRELTLASDGYVDLSAQVARIRLEITAYQEREAKRRRDDEDDFITLELL